MLARYMIWTPVAETRLDLHQMISNYDGLPVWYPLKACKNAAPTSRVWPGSGRRLSKAFSDDNSPTIATSDQSGSCLSPAGSSPFCAAITRSRSVEADFNQLLKPVGSWSSSAVGCGLSAPASLAPSRRGSAIGQDGVIFAIDNPLVSADRSPSRRESSGSASRRESSGSASEMDSTSELGPATCGVENAAEEIGGGQVSQVTQKMQAILKMPPTPATRHGFSLLAHGSHQRTDQTLVSAAELTPGPYATSEGLARESRTTAGQIKLGLVYAKGSLQVDVIAARNLPSLDCTNPPDTWVKVLYILQYIIFISRSPTSTFPPNFRSIFVGHNATSATRFTLLKNIYIRCLLNYLVTFTLAI